MSQQEAKEIIELALKCSNFNTSHLIFGHKEDFAIEIVPAKSTFRYDPKLMRMAQKEIFKLRIYNNSRIILDLPYDSMWEVKCRIRQFNTKQLR